MANIVILDGGCVNPGDLGWEGLAALGPLQVYERTSPAQVAARAAGAEIVLTNKTPLDRETLSRLGSLRYIGLLATGYNVVDVRAARERGIVVTNVPTYGTDSVAQMVFAHLLHHTQAVARHASSVAEGGWSAREDFCFWETPLIELASLNLGILGFGRIGRAVARIASAFRMNVLAYDPALPDPLPDGVRRRGLDALFAESDVLSLHCPLTPDTERVVNRRTLALMKPAAFLINTARGQLVDEEALAEALNLGRIAGAGLDVLSREPPDPSNPLLHARNCAVTPHNAWATRPARARLLACVVENVKAFLEGRPRNEVLP